MSRYILFILLITFTFSSDFPNRKKYPNLKYISMEEFVKIKNNSIIIDSRDEYEFNVIHIKGAKNLPRLKMTKEKLLKLRTNN